VDSVATSKVLTAAILVSLCLTLLWGEACFGNGAPPLAATLISLDHRHFPFIYLNVAIERFGEGIGYAVGILHQFRCIEMLSQPLTVAGSSRG